MFFQPRKNITKAASTFNPLIVALSVLITNSKDSLNTETVVHNIWKRHY